MPTNHEHSITIITKIRIADHMQMLALPFDGYKRFESNWII